MSNSNTDLCIVGGGPAGMMAGLLFARAGVRTVVLEKHNDFLRDFRGDTVHPSTLELFCELGLVDELLARPHSRLTRLSMPIAGRRYTIVEFTRLRTPCPFVALMPQWDFLDCVKTAAERFPAFSLRMDAGATDLIELDDRIAGVRLGSGEEVRSRLVIAADGRDSIVRREEMLPRRDLGAPMDVFWFRLPKALTEDNQTGGALGAGRMLATLDRGDYWQCAYIFAKGSADAVRARGLELFRSEIEETAPWLAGLAHAIDGWDDVKLLTVTLDRLTRWHRPGLLAIGDAAHAMSPIGGIGINLAIQDAVAAANLLAGPMARGDRVDGLLAKVQARRMLPTRVMQGIQKAAQDNIVSAVLASKTAPRRAPLPVRLLDRYGWLRQFPARLMGLGVRREHIRSPEAPR